MERARLDPLRSLRRLRPGCLRLSRGIITPCPLVSPRLLQMSKKPFRFSGLRRRWLECHRFWLTAPVYSYPLSQGGVRKMAESSAHSSADEALSPSHLAIALFEAKCWRTGTRVCHTRTLPFRYPVSTMKNPCRESSRSALSLVRRSPAGLGPRDTLAVIRLGFPKAEVPKPRTAKPFTCPTTSPSVENADGAVLYELLEPVFP